MIYVTGDVHFPIDAGKLYYANRLLKPNDILIVAGDMGVVWKDEATSTYNITKLMSKVNYTILFCDGNHEHHPLLNQYPTVCLYGGKMHILHDRLYHLMRAETFTIEKSTFLVMGGAYSIDQQLRVPYVDWFPEEEASYEEMDRCLTKAESKRFDYIITHDAPTEICKQLYPTRYTSSVTEKFLSELRIRAKYKHWYCGHHHTNKEFGKITILYNEIHELTTNKNIYTAKGHIHDYARLRS